MPSSAARRWWVEQARSVLEELGFGHGPSALTVPLGLPCVLDADARTLTFDVPALV